MQTFRQFYRSCWRWHIRADVLVFLLAVGVFLYDVYVYMFSQPLKKDLLGRLLVVELYCYGFFLAHLIFVIGSVLWFAFRKNGRAAGWLLFHALLLVAVAYMAFFAFSLMLLPGIN